MKSGAFFLKKNFVFLWGLRPRPNLPRPWAGPGRNNNANNRKLKKKNSPQQCDNNSSFTDRESRHVNGSDFNTDVIIVGTGVAVAALAYTLSKVHFANTKSLVSSQFIYFFSYEILFLTVTWVTCYLSNCGKCLFVMSLRN